MSETPDEKKQASKEDPPKPDTEASNEQMPSERSGFTLEDFIPILTNLLVPRAVLTTIPTFVPKTFVDSIQLYTDGTDTWLYLYVSNAWHAFMANSVTRLVAGLGITLSPSDGRGVVTVSGAPIINSGLESRGGSDASGSQAIAHGLGKVPALFRIEALWGSGTPQLLKSVGTYGANGMKNINSYTLVGTGGGTGNDTTNIVVISDRGGNAQFAAVASMDATNINLNWTKAGALGGTVHLLWEAFG
jgi:hypothetical protein